VTRTGQAAGQLPLLSTAPVPEPDRPVLRVVIPCSKRKLASDAPATRAELDMRRSAVEARLASEVRAARDMYTGRAYRRAVAAVDRFAELRPDLPVALHIASAGYGLVGARDQLVPYEATMGRHRRQWIERGQLLRMPAEARALVESCDVAVFALSQPYFHGANLAGLEPESGLAVVIGVAEMATSLHRRGVRAGRREARALGTTEREVAAVVLDRLLGWIAVDGLTAACDLPGDPLEWPQP
jgi:hypothetical protein